LNVNYNNPLFAQKLEVSFRVRIFEDKFLIPNLIKNSRVIKPAESGQLWGSSKQKSNLEIENLDIRKLEFNLSKINLNQVYERRKIYNQLYHVSEKIFFLKKKFF